jgi:predicted nucleic acid-binding protein
LIILDTNVLSALMQSAPEPRVVRWLDRLPGESTWTTSVSVFEVLVGLATMPGGKRKRAYEDAFSRLLSEDLENRVLDFDVAAASEAAAFAAVRRRQGRPVDFRDLQIAGIAMARRSSIATRNARDFEGAGIAIVDPWRN